MIPNSTAEIDLPADPLDEVVGQREAVDIIRLAARQQRYVLIIGEPGTGKSMLGRAIAGLRAATTALDLVARPNPDSPTQPHLESVVAGEGARQIKKVRQEVARQKSSNRWLSFCAIGATVLVTGVQVWKTSNPGYILGGLVVLIMILALKRWLRSGADDSIPVMLVSADEHTPFVDATGARAGGLLGDVRHDPYQSGGAETPPHRLLEAGAIHRAHGGVLFIDEAATLDRDSQQQLLTAIQEKKLAITGRSPGSSGTMVRSNPAACDFQLVLAGNEEDLRDLHPALRSRIRGFGYEIRTRSDIEDNDQAHLDYARFIAQEVRRDGRIPHFDRNAVEAVIEEARRRSSLPGHLSARFRELGGLVRVAGDLAIDEGASLVAAAHVGRARELTRNLETPSDDSRRGEHVIAIDRNSRHA